MRRLGNLSLWAINLSAAAVIGQSFDDGANAPLTLIGLVEGVLALDALTYALHRAQHSSPIMWLFHKLHHSDRAVDATTAVRHHPLEILAAQPLVWLTIGVCHITPEIVGAHGLVALAMQFTTHTRRAWPRWIERVLAPVIITREMHLLHHSAEPGEADTNYGGIFCWWDRIFRTFAPGRMPKRFGV